MILSKKHFKNIDAKYIFDKIIILDIDGTITSDGSLEIDREIIEVVYKLKSNNKVYLLSNNKILDRNNKIAEILDVTYLNTPYKKPNKKIVNYLGRIDKKIVVIGDKYITDGLFARRIGGQFIKVKRIIGEKETFKTKLIYIIDYSIGALFF